MVQSVEPLRELLQRFNQAIKKLQEADPPLSMEDGGWTIREIFTHLADSQPQAYFRIKWLLTEDNTTLKPFDQDDWNSLVSDEDIEGSILLLQGCYKRWLAMMESITEDEWNKRGTHPEYGKVTVESMYDRYVTHGNHHLNQLESMIERAN